MHPNLIVSPNHLIILIVFVSVLCGGLAGEMAFRCWEAEDNKC